MNIAFDSIAQLGPMSKNRGIGNYADAQFRTLINLDRDNHYFFFNIFDETDVFGREELEGLITENDFLCMRNGQFIEAENYQQLYGELVKNYIKKNRIDVFYITSPFDILVPIYRKEWFNGVKTVATVYDIIPYVMRDHYFPGMHDIDWYMERIEMLRWVDRLLVISQSVKDDLVNYLEFDPDKIDVIWGAPSDMFREMEGLEKEEAAIREKYNIEGHFVMCTGGDDERKNIAELIKAFSMLPQTLLNKYQLVIVCKLQPASVDRYSELSRKCKIGDRVVLTNFVSNDELIQLYNLADLVAFPSVYEGFGLPIVEAWACGTGVVTSNNSSLGQIAGEAAVLVDPYSTKDIARGLQEALEGDLEALAQKGKERLKMFSWEKVAQQTCDSIEAVGRQANSINRKDNTPKTRIAFFSPLPPLQSGISDYSVDIIVALASYFDIDVYIDSGYTSDVALPENVSVISHKKYDSNRKLYRETVFQVGNSEYHVYMWPYIKKWGGLVVLHDYNMHGVVMAKFLGAQRDIKAYRKILEEDLDSAACDMCMAATDDWKKLDRLRTDVEINGFIINYARKIIVHSIEAKEKLLNKDIGRNVRHIPSYAKIKPLVDVQRGKSKLGISEKTVVFAAFGHVHRTKRAIQILKAFALLTDKYENAMLFFGGKMDTSLENEFDSTVAELHLKDKVKVTGYLDLDEFLDYMDATDICMNLRWPYNGETSGSLMRMLAKGKCIMVNDIGSFAEIPDDCCIKLPSVETMSENREVLSIYQAMQELCMNDDLRAKISTNARRYAERELDLEIIVKKYRDYILDNSEKVVTEELIGSLRGLITKLALNQQDVLRLARTLAYVKK